MRTSPAEFVFFRVLLLLLLLLLFLPRPLPPPRVLLILVPVLLLLYYTGHIHQADYFAITGAPTHIILYLKVQWYW